MALRSGNSFSKEGLKKTNVLVSIVFSVGPIRGVLFARRVRHIYTYWFHVHVEVAGILITQAFNLVHEYKHSLIY